MGTPRGNGNARGSTKSRRVRKAWLVETYRADVDLNGEPACRCFRCGKLLTKATVTIDRVLCGINGGTYRRENIRPACGRCNSALGGALGHERRKAG